MSNANGNYAIASIYILIKRIGIFLLYYSIHVSCDMYFFMHRSITFFCTILSVYPVPSISYCNKSVFNSTCALHV